MEADLWADVAERCRRRDQTVRPESLLTQVDENRRSRARAAANYQHQHDRSLRNPAGAQSGAAAPWQTPAEDGRHGKDKGAKGKGFGKDKGGKGFGKAGGKATGPKGGALAPWHSFNR